MYSICFNFQPQLVLVFYWKTKQPGTYILQSGFPTFYDCTISDGRCLYGLPSFEYPNLFKVSVLHVPVNGVSAYNFPFCSPIISTLQGSMLKWILAGLLIRSLVFYSLTCVQFYMKLILLTVGALR